MHGMVVTGAFIQARRHQLVEDLGGRRALMCVRTDCTKAETNA